MKNKLGPSPHEKYPKSKTIQAVFSGPKKKEKKPALCEHNNIDYVSMKNLASRSITIINRLSQAIIILEEKLKRYEKDKS